MKIISKTLKLLPVFLLVLGLTGCSDDDNNPDGPIAEVTTIVDVAVANNLNSLAAALTRADLVTTLQGTGPFTVFGPTDLAFQNLLDSNDDWNSLEDIPLDLLTKVLLNHVIIGSNFASTDLLNAGDGYVSTAATGPDNANLSLYFNTANGVFINGTTEVTNADNEATNGVLHIVNEVILPPTVVTFAVANPAFSNLVAALGVADGQTPSPELIPTLSGDGPFTVFAPTDDAFAALLLELDETGNTGLGDLDPALVEDVLTFHVVGDNVRSTELQSGMVPTLGGTIMLDANNLTITDANGRVSNIVVDFIDIQGANGVVHVIDRVILPELEVEDELNILDIANEAGLTVLSQAIDAADLEDTFNDILAVAGEFTVFAPTNEAFTALLNSNDDWNELGDIPLTTLTTVLLNHTIIGTTVVAEDLISAGSGYTNTSATGPDGDFLSLYFNVVEGTVQLNGGFESAVGANVAQPNVEVGEGVIHVINKVLLPPTVVDFALANPALTNLVAALGVADGQNPSPSLIPTLSGEGPFTVFAPTDAAFGDLLLELDETGNTALGDLDAALVEDVLLMHVVSGNVTSDELATTEVPVLGGTINIDANALTITDPNGRISNIVLELVNIQGANGVVHVIDRVILPPLD